MDNHPHHSDQPTLSTSYGKKINYHRFSFRRREKIVIWILSLLFSICLGCGIGLFITYVGEIPLVSDLKAYKPSLSTKIYDCKNQLITELFSEQRTLIRIDDIPNHLEHALLAIEDNNFYHHSGIELSGIIRSFLVNFSHKKIKQGGSTITQQLARNMFLTRQKTVERKIKEIILAFQIELTYSKREILEMYFNQIYYGNGAHGIEAASQVYFGKHVNQLDLPECALLAGMPQLPNVYNPYLNPKRALERRNIVLAQMERFGYISSTEAEAAKTAPIKLSKETVSEAPYFVEHVRQQLEDRYGSTAIYQSGLNVSTTLDLALQQMAQKAMDEGIQQAESLILPRMQVLSGQKPETIQCALVLLDPATGEIKALIGGRNFQQSKFNRALQAKRQPGSSFKPIIYATAFGNGFTQADVILDTPVVFNFNKEVWKPENFGNKFRGPTTIRSALTNSRNVVTVKLLNKIGIQAVMEQAKKMGIKSQLNPSLSLALGSSEVTLLEMVSAFGSFPNHGVHVEPFSIRRVENHQNEVLEENLPYQEDVLDPGVAAVVTDLLENVVNRGTATVVRSMGFKYPAAGKTGTTNEYSDAWFIGFTSDYVAGIWIGLDSHDSLGRGITGGLVAAPIWAKLMLQIYASRTPKKFPIPSNVEMVNFCNTSGLLPNPGCQTTTVTGAFVIGTAPTQHCDVHYGLSGESVANFELNLSPDLADMSGNSKTIAFEDDEAGNPMPSDNPIPAGSKPIAPSSAPTNPAVPADSDRPVMF